MGGRGDRGKHSIQNVSRLASTKSAATARHVCSGQLVRAKSNLLCGRTLVANRLRCRWVCPRPDGPNTILVGKLSSPRWVQVSASRGYCRLTLVTPGIAFSIGRPHAVSIAIEIRHAGTAASWVCAALASLPCRPGFSACLGLRVELLGKSASMFRPARINEGHLHGNGVGLRSIGRCGLAGRTGSSASLAARIRAEECSSPSLPVRASRCSQGSILPVRSRTDCGCRRSRSRDRGVAAS